MRLARRPHFENPSEWLEEMGKPIPGVGDLRKDKTGNCDLSEISGEISFGAFCCHKSR